MFFPQGCEKNPAFLLYRKKAIRHSSYMLVSQASWGSPVNGLVVGNDSNYWEILLFYCDMGLKGRLTRDISLTCSIWFAVSQQLSMDFTAMTPMQHNLSSSHVPGPRLKSILSISVNPMHLKSCPLLTGDYTFSPISDFRQLLRTGVPWVNVTCATGRKNKCSSLSGRYPPGYYGKKCWSGGDLSAKLVKIAFKVLQRPRLLIILHANYFHFCHVLPSCVLWESGKK